MSIKNLDALEKFITLPEGKKLSDLISDEEEHEVSINEKLKIFDTEEDFNTLIENKKKEFETAGREKLLKSMRDNAELKYEGVKDPNKFTEALIAKIKTETLESAKIEPDKKIQELESDLSGLRGQITKKDEEITGLNDTIKQTGTASSISELIRSALPEKTLIPKEEVVQLVGGKVDLRFEDGKALLFENGEVVKDNLANPVNPLDRLKELSAPYAVAVSGGTGGGDEGGGNKSSYDSFAKEMKAKGVNEGSEEFQKEVIKRTEAGTLTI